MQSTTQKLKTFQNSGSPRSVTNLEKKYLNLVAVIQTGTTEKLNFLKNNGCLVTATNFGKKKNLNSVVVHLTATTKKFKIF